MIDGIPLGLLNGIGVVGVVLIVGYLLATGRLITRSSHQDVLHDRDEWRAAHRISEVARQEEREHNLALQHEFGTTLTHFLQSIRQATGIRGED